MTLGGGGGLMMMTLLDKGFNDFNDGGEGEGGF